MNSEKELYDYLYSKIKNHYGTAGLMGNLKAESSLNPMNLQNNYEKKLGYTDKTYTEAVDNGTYTDFIYDSAGYGLAQWTYHSRKRRLLEFAQYKNKSIGDLKMQADFLLSELEKSYPTILKVLKNAKSVLEASNEVLINFERPKDQSKSVQDYRCKLSMDIYNNFSKPTNHKVVGGKVLKLNNVPCYTNSTISEHKSLKTGTFYLWSDEIINKRVKITTTKDRVGVAGQVTGWINVSDVK